jgi:hypothetical protein
LKMKHLPPKTPIHLKNQPMHQSFFSPPPPHHPPPPAPSTPSLHPRTPLSTHDPPHQPKKKKFPPINSLHVLTTYQKIGRGMLSSTPADVAIDSINNTPVTADEVQINFKRKFHLLGIRFLLLCISFTLLLLFGRICSLTLLGNDFCPPNLLS